MSQPPDTVTAVDLHAALRRGVAGLRNEEAAINLLGQHDHWLHLPEFRQFVDYSDDPNITGCEQPLAVVYWAELSDAALLWWAQHDYSTPLQILDIALSLANRAPIRLADALLGLHTRDVIWVLNAIAHATDNGELHLDPDHGWLLPDAELGAGAANPLLLEEIAHIRRDRRDWSRDRGSNAPRPGDHERLTDLVAFLGEVAQSFTPYTPSATNNELTPALIHLVVVALEWLDYLEAQALPDYDLPLRWDAQPTGTDQN